VRQDLNHVDHHTERPTDEEYARYLWLLELLKRKRYDEAEIYDSHPFLVKDALFSAVLVAANEALSEIARVVGAPEEEAGLVEAWISRGREGLEEQWDPELGLCLDHDLRRDAPLGARTIAGFAPLVAGGQDPDRLDALLKTLDSAAFLGNPRLRLQLPPSASPEEAHFQPRNYWRGPVWPVANWLLWRSLVRAGESGRAEDLRRTALHQLAGGNFAEYYEPFTGEPLGSDDQSWTAAVALDWLAYEEVP
jgi:glucosylglycerate hydrolase